MSSLPKGWIQTPISRIVLPTDTANPSKRGPGHFHYVDIEALDNRRHVIRGARLIPNEEAPSRARMVIQRGDILFSLVRPYLKNIALVPSELHGEIASTAYCVLRPNGAAEAKFLFYQLTQDSFISAIPTYGNSPPSARDTEFLSSPIIIAPLPEQRRIVAKLDELLSDLDAGVAALERAKANLKRYKASLLRAAVEGKLTEEWRRSQKVATSARTLFVQAGKQHSLDTTSVPQLQLPGSWCWATTEMLAKDEQNAICAGPFGTIFKAHDFRPSGVPIIFLRHVSEGRYLTHKPGFMDEKKWEQLFRPYSVFGGELLVTKLGEPPGVAAIYPKDIGPAMVTPDVIKLDVDSRIVEPRWVMHFLNSQIGKRAMFGAAFGVTRLRVTLPIFRRTAIPIPPREEQEVIVEELESHFSAIEAANTAIEAASARAKWLRQSILREAFAGRLVAQDPNDEPAAALLARIKQESGNG